MVTLVKTVLITSGGTIEKIDDVRYIGNFSSGTFPSRLAEEALRLGHRVRYIHAKRAVLPFAGKIPKQYAARLRLIPYETFAEYETTLRHTLQESAIDIAMLGAAVSDYGVKPQKGKISSDRENLTLTLTRNPKVIRNVKQWSKQPLFQIGFKLFSGATRQEMIEVGYKALIQNRSDITLTNDLQQIRAGKRQAILVTAERGTIHLKEPDLAKQVMRFVEKRALTTHFKTTVRTDRAFGRRYAAEITEFQRLCRQLYRKGLMPNFYKDYPSCHGSLALKLDDGSFLITSRGSDKESLRPADVVQVEGVDWRKRAVAARSLTGKKPSLNAVLVARIFQRFPKAQTMVHTHSFATGFPYTKFPQTPGTLEYADEPIPQLRRARIVNLIDHGLIAIGTDLTETVRDVTAHTEKPVVR